MSYGDNKRKVDFRFLAYEYGHMKFNFGKKIIIFWNENTFF